MARALASATADGVYDFHPVAGFQDARRKGAARDDLLIDLDREAFAGKTQVDDQVGGGEAVGNILPGSIQCDLHGILHRVH
jgi:hypothetical protein